MRRLVVITAIAVSAAGCIPIPYVVAPLKVRLAGGVANEMPDARPATMGQGAFDFTGGVNPLQWFDTTRTRLFDVGVQYRLEHSSLGTRHGGSVEGSMLVALNESRSLRLVPRASLDAMYRPGAWAPGITMGLGVEWVGWFDGYDEGTENRFAIGVHYGEGAIGLDLSGTYRRYPGSNDWGITLGLIGRIPALAGFTSIWIWELVR